MKVGLKLYVTNENYLKPAVKMFNDGVYDYIEVFLVVGKSIENISKWIETEIPLAFHAPHSYGGFNLSLAENEGVNRVIMKEIVEVCSIHKPEYIVFHPGINGKIEETIKQFNNLFDLYPRIRDFAYIENKPLLGMNGERCLGATPEEIKLIRDRTQLKFCLDFGHAICAAASYKLNWKDSIEQFLELAPHVFHLSDGHILSGIDEHLHLTSGDFDLPWCLSRVETNSYLALETEKISQDSLDDFLGDANFVKTTINKKK